eukprot:maker-scaffold_5-snap-gene-6.49-mRNA-1 protein AED:0.00 eAED:0.00 QI:90/1/1/1/1/1/2/117/144
MSYSVSPEIQTEYTSLKIKRAYRMLTFKIENEEIIVDQKIARGQDINFALGQFPEFDPRYVIWDVPEPTTENSKLYFITWCPDTIPTERGMIYIDQKKTISNIFSGAQPVDARSKDELKRAIPELADVGEEEEDDDNSNWMDEA